VGGKWERSGVKKKKRWQENRDSSFNKKRKKGARWGRGLLINQLKKDREKRRREKTRFARANKTPATWGTYSCPRQK